MESTTITEEAFDDRKKQLIDDKLRAKDIERAQQKKGKQSELDKDRDPNEDYNYIDSRYNQTLHSIQSQI